MLKHNNLYYLFYTANDFRHPNYNVGYATSTSPLGPWTKYTGNPIVPKTEGVQGTGHCAFIDGANNSLVMFYHAHYSTTSVAPRKTVYSTCTWQPVTGAADVLQVSAQKNYPVFEEK
jgi:beta-xylosidase